MSWEILSFIILSKKIQKRDGTKISWHMCLSWFVILHLQPLRHLFIPHWVLTHMGNLRIGHVRPSVRPTSYLRDGWTDFHEIAHYDGHISWDDARHVGFSKFWILAKLGQFFVKIWDFWTLFDYSLVIMCHVPVKLTRTMSYHPIFTFQFEWHI